MECIFQEITLFIHTLIIICCIIMRIRKALMEDRVGKLLVSDSKV